MCLRIFLKKVSLMPVTQTIFLLAPAPKPVFFGVIPNAEKHGLSFSGFFCKKKFRFYNNDSMSGFFSKKSQKRSINLYIS